MHARVARLTALATLLLAVLVESAVGQARSPRFWFTGWGGGYTDVGGFSDGPTDFYQFDGSLGFGGAIHWDTHAGIMLGVEGLWAQPSYTRYDRTTNTAIANGDATVWSALASVRLAGGGGPLGITLNGSGGIFAWDVPDLGEINYDPALAVGIGIDLALRRNLMIFGQYDQWWVYHEKEDVQTNTAHHNAVRIGARFGIG